jgi:hypothetical protein
LVYRILFPTYEFNYVFASTGLANNIINPRTIATTINGSPQTQMLFNLNSQGEFDKAKITITLTKDSVLAKNTAIEIQKSFQSFFDPVGTPLGFKDGSLLRDGSNYYLVSDGKLRMFSSLEIAQAFGLDEQAFANATTNDMRFNGAGDDISDSRSLVDDLLYKVGDTYYQVRNGQLWPFTSEKAFLSQYDKSQFISEDQQFLSTQIVSQNAIGYADGTLASIGQSVIILSGGKYYPINNPTTFDDMGYDWNDVVPIGSDELALYVRQKQFTETNQHPDGTIFVDKTTGKYYMAKNGHELPIPSQAILNSYLKHSPVEVSSQSLTVKTSPCILQKNLWPLNSYSCTTSLTILNQLIGNDFQFLITSAAPLNPLSINVVLSSYVSITNLRATLHHLIHSTTLSSTFPAATSNQ